MRCYRESEVERVKDIHDFRESELGLSEAKRWRA